MARDSLQADATSIESEVVDGKVLADVYYLYLRTVCSGSIPNSPDDNSDAIVVELCETYGEASDSE